MSLDAMSLKDWARKIRRDVVALWFAARDPRTPTLARVLAAATAAYALSPIDLIPDFIPVLGYLDELIILPAGIMLAVRLIPAGLMEEFRQKASAINERPSSKAAAAAILLVWLTVTSLAGWYLYKAIT